jgi:hypothetical protein
VFERAPIIGPPVATGHGTAITDLACRSGPGFSLQSRWHHHRTTRTTSRQTRGLLGRQIDRGSQCIFGRQPSLHVDRRQPVAYDEVDSRTVDGRTWILLVMGRLKRNRGRSFGDHGILDQRAIATGDRAGSRSVVWRLPDRLQDTLRRLRRGERRYGHRHERRPGLPIQRRPNKDGAAEPGEGLVGERQKRVLLTADPAPQQIDAGFVAPKDLPLVVDKLVQR